MFFVALSVFGLGCDDGFSFVETANRADAMRHFHFVALRAFDETRYRQFPIGTSFVATRSRAFVFRSRHVGTSLLIGNTFRRILGESPEKNY